jgi:AmmeMemoRadiSam system protein A
VLSPRDRKTLLELARASVAAAAAGKPLPELEPAGVLAEPGAAFVTLRRDGALRGCVGHVQATEPLWRSVRDMARSAAVQDTRFPPVKTGEVPALTVEISVLSPLRPMKQADELQVGRHGLYICSGYQAGLLLPQVATSAGWDRRTFLEQTCRKAGLKSSAWDDPTVKVYVFEADVFGEQEQSA